MALGPGTRLGAYEILTLIGSGGMGEVYRAKDTKLGRDVALKILPSTFTNDPERLARFRREAQVLASLNHPHIGAIYGLDEADGQQFLVLELVDGESLDKRIARGKIPVDEALGVAKQIAEALEAAHEKGIIHRDLKPANIALTKDGHVKVLDFGLAKAVENPSGSVDAMNSPTITTPAMMTGVGVILGTAAYMSPEQVRGKAVDKRADIWAFGAVLYEMLTGRRAFQGEDISLTLAEVMKSEPDWTLLPADVSVGIRAVLKRCLQKDPRHRLHDIADVRIEVDDALAIPTATLPLTESRTSWRGRLSLVALIASLITAVAVWNLKPINRSPSGPVARFAAPLPFGEQPLSADLLWRIVAISPDGTRFVYAQRAAGGPSIYVRAIDQTDFLPLSGTEHGRGPFFSPDSQWIGFFAGSQLKKVSTNGGAPLAVCDVSNPLGASATWGAGDAIVFAPSQGSGLFKVSADGGTPQVLTTLDPKKGEVAHGWPHFLPGGKALLFSIRSASKGWDDAQVVVQSLDTGERRVLIQGGSNAHYSPTGHLIYVHAGTLFGVPFSLARLQVTGTPSAVVGGITTHPTSGAVQLDVSATGSLIYLPAAGGELDPKRLVWVNRSGVAEPLAAPLRSYQWPRLSPDGARIVVKIFGATADLWVFDIIRSTLTRLTFEGYNNWPIWAPDGQRVTFASDKAGPQDLFSTLANGSGAEERLTKGEFVSPGPDSYTPDGRALVFANGDIWILPMDGDHKPRAFLKTPYYEGHSKLSPDGRWLAYLSDESGRSDLYVQSFPNPGEKYQISADGATEPVWSRDGRELFYRNGDKMMAVGIATATSFIASKPRQLFEGYVRVSSRPNYDVAPDGRFLMLQAVEQPSTSAHLNVVLNWTEELKARVSTK